MFNINPYQRGNGILHRLDPRIKMIGFAGTVVAIIFSGSRLCPAQAVMGLFLMSLFVVGQVNLWKLLARLAPALSLIVLALISLLLGADWQKVMLLIVITGLVTGFFILMSATTPLTDILSSMSTLRLPNALVGLTAVSCRFIHVIIDEISSMLRAHRLRGGSVGIRQSLVGFKGISAVLCIRSYLRSEKIADAMVIRGFDGRFRTLILEPMSGIQRASAALYCLAIVAIGWFLR